MAPDRRTAALTWVTVAVWALMAVVMYGAGYRIEAGTRAGAEPEMAGLTCAFPFAALALAGVVWAIDIGAVDRDRRLVGLRRMTAAAVVLAVLVVAVLCVDSRGGYPVPDAINAGGLILAGLFAPLLVLWSSHRRSVRRHVGLTLIVALPRPPAASARRAAARGRP